MDYTTERPIRDRLEQLQKERQRREDQMRCNWERMSELVHLNDGEREVIRTIDDEVMQLKYKLGIYDGKLESVNQCAEAPVQRIPDEPFLRKERRTE